MICLTVSPRASPTTTLQERALIASASVIGDFVISSFRPTMMPLLVRTVCHIFTSRSSLYFTDCFFFALPAMRRPMPLLSLDIGPQTQLTMTLRAAFCTSGSAMISPSASPRRMLMAWVDTFSGSTTDSHSSSCVLGVTEQMVSTSSALRMVSALALKAFHSAAMAMSCMSMLMPPSRVSCATGSHCMRSGRHSNSSSTLSWITSGASLHAYRQGQVYSLHAYREGQVYSLHAYREGQVYSLHPYRQGQVYNLHAYREGQVYSLYAYRQGQVYSLHAYREGQVYSLHAYRQGQVYSLHAYREGQVYSLNPTAKQDRDKSTA
ncbi:hypothetical protein NP493_452g02027 [Ridgeia piscesae]|uniref:Uncharacterized protein n=1 Tax=Ridgeia piscesae TaxID=27915 RepID=A0AAD9KYX7_RIDPI|nr:hypothetical protein NP493_452g02027 [Ridgeia piscesae]